MWNVVCLLCTYPNIVCTLVHILLHTTVHTVFHYFGYVAYYMYGLSLKPLFAYSCVSCTYIPCTCLPTIAYYCTLMCTIVHHCILFDITRPPLHITVPMHILCPLLYTIAHYCTLIHIGLHPSLQGVVEFSLAFFFVKMVNYVFKAWLPFYIATTGTPYPHIWTAKL